jgi:hypothetical protein
MANPSSPLPQVPFPKPKPGYIVFTETAACYHRALHKVLGSTMQPILPHLREKAHALLDHPIPSDPEIQRQCKETMHAIIERRHTLLGHEEWRDHHRAHSDKHRKSGNHAQADFHETEAGIHESAVAAIHGRIAKHGRQGRKP